MQQIGGGVKHAKEYTLPFHINQFEPIENEEITGCPKWDSG